MGKSNEVSKEDMSVSISNHRSEQSSLSDFVQKHVGLPHEPKVMRLDSAKN